MYMIRLPFTHSRVRYFKLMITHWVLSLGSTFGKVLWALTLFTGLFITFAGHRYFQFEMLVLGFAIFSTVSYIILVNHFDPDVTGKNRSPFAICFFCQRSWRGCVSGRSVGLAAGTSSMGLIGGLLWWFVWWFWGIPALSVLPAVLMLGFLMASILFYLPISFEFLTNDFNFWSAFSCCWLVLPAIFVTFTRLVSRRVTVSFETHEWWPCFEM